MLLPAVPSPPPLLIRQSSGDNQNSGFQPAIYIPVIALVFILLFVITGSYLRQRLRRSHLARVYSREQDSVRQLTADQLAGNNANTNTAGNSNDGNNTSNVNAGSRRPRRNRRRPSQVSVTSLPLYMEDAGDTELVLVRGDREMQDAMPDGSETYRRGEGDHDEEGHEEVTLHPPNPIYSPRPSYDSVDSLPESDHDHGIRPQSNQRNSNVPLGDAPSYEEALAQGSPAISSNQTQTTTPALSNVSSSHAQSPTNINVPSPTNTQRSSGQTGSGSTSRRLQLPMPTPLRNLFQRSPSSSSSGAQNNNTPPPGRNSRLGRSSSRVGLLNHQRSTSTFSTASSNAPSRLGHHGNSSMISLASISAPLSHTLTRTDINYPRNGPTVEQMRFLGSRESLGLFGVPWGEAAVRYASVDPPPFVPNQGDAPATSTEPTITLVQPTVQEDETTADDRGHDREATVTPATPRVEPVSPVKIENDVDGLDANPSTDETSTVVPSMIVREPTPGPPTPPPTPPRTSTALPNTASEQAVVSVAS